MAPKAKAKVRAAGKARARGVRLRPAALGVLRRPGHGPLDEAPVPRELWMRGDEVAVHEIGVEDLEIGSFIAFTDASYYGAEMKVAGTLKGVDVQPEAIHYQISVTGTTSEALLKYQSGKPGACIRVHRCPNTCTGERIAEDLVHGLRMKRPSRMGGEEGWMRSLEAVDPVDPG